MNKFQIQKSVKKTKRVGRGPSSGKGKTSGRGMSGQGSRTGASTSQTEGGQTKLIMRLPKAGGFKNNRKPNKVTLTTDQIKTLFKDGGEVTLETIAAKLKLSSRVMQVKIIKGRSDLGKIKLGKGIVISASLINNQEEKSSEKKEK